MDRSCLELMGGNEFRTQALLGGGLDMLLVSRPTHEQGGGDLYCLHSCEGIFTKIMLLDITGHGEHAATIARSVHSLLHEYSTDTKPDQILALVNRDFVRFAPPGILATSLCAVYDSRRGQFRYANAGQPRPLLWRVKERRWITLAPSAASLCGLPFGVTAEECYEEESTSFAPGDLVLLFSDGVPETRSLTEDFLGPEGVLMLAQECTDEMPPAFPLTALARRFLSRLAQLNGGPHFQDDITLLWLRCIGPEGNDPRGRETEDDA